MRDLENALERSVLLCRKPVLDATDLRLIAPPVFGDGLDNLPEPREGFSLKNFISQIRQHMPLRVLKAADGNQSQAARLLGISPEAVHKFLRSRS